VGFKDDWRALFHPEAQERSGNPYSLNQLASDILMSFDGTVYPLGGMQQTLKGHSESIQTDFVGLVQGAYKANGIVFAAELARQSLFSEARFQFRRIVRGVPGDLYGTEALSPLQTPWPTGTTGDLLTRALADADFAGTAFNVGMGGGIRRLRPDWVDIVLGKQGEPEIQAGDVDVDVLGIIYYPGGRHSGRESEIFLREQVSIFAPIPDPLATFKGIPWLTAVLRDIQADQAANSHKQSLFENGATPNMLVKLDTKGDDFAKFVKLFKESHEGSSNAYKTLFVNAATEVSTIGANLQQLDYREVIGAGEVRIAAASGIHPAILGLSDSLDGSTLNTGNFNAARRLTADKTLRPLWRSFCASIAPLIRVPSDSELWYDERDIAFLREDLKDAAEIQQLQANTLKALIDAGFDPDSAVAAVNSGDFARLAHTGLFSVQLQPPGTMAPSLGNPILDVKGELNP
jgi:hypothetical protein